MCVPEAPVPKGPGLSLWGVEIPGTSHWLKSLLCRVQGASASGHKAKGGPFTPTKRSNSAARVTEKDVTRNFIDRAGLVKRLKGIRNDFEAAQYLAVFIKDKANATSISVGRAWVDNRERLKAVVECDTQRFKLNWGVSFEEACTDHTKALNERARDSEEFKQIQELLGAIGYINSNLLNTSKLKNVAALLREFAQEDAGAEA